ncbi:MAG TPA: NAD(P)H-hydrate dehydratase, partial [Chitinophagaceae bacterium]|nr:NAD(P)H-hydrate dehydratase [Chitinophagaceae bacterium]
MNLLTAAQIREWDRYTIQQEPVTSVDLMERAATACTRWLLSFTGAGVPYSIFCGKGNNGGDGLAIARQLIQQGIQAEVFILEFGKMGTADFQANLQRLHELPVDLHYIQSAEQLPPIEPGTVILDALFGSGLQRPLEGLAAILVDHLNQAPGTRVAIDVPSGLFLEQSSRGNTVFRAAHTLTFQIQKMAFLLAENAPYTGRVHVLDIGLHSSFLPNPLPSRFLVTPEFVRSLFRTRELHAHKGHFGHALIVAGRKGMIGAALMAARACARSGAGLVTALVPECGYAILQSGLPEAMVLTGGPDRLEHTPDHLERFTAMGIGPGLGTDPETVAFVGNLLTSARGPVVLDADALNALAHSPGLWAAVPPLSLLTPHPGEFRRLAGESADDFARLQQAAELAAQRNVIIILKGHHTAILLPDGRRYFNATGNPGMAKGGSGDVLTGMLTALLAQGYPPDQAALLGVYLHGLA